MFISAWLVFISILLLGSSFFLYPFLLFISQLWVKPNLAARETVAKPSSVSVIVVVYNSEHLIADKLNNLLQLNYDGLEYEILVYLDGCTDNTLKEIEQLGSDKIYIINEPQHLGKTAGLNKAVSMAKNDILFFTDADAILEPNVIDILLNKFKDPLCGGVCGLRAIKEKKARMRLAQQLYITVDSYIKQLENSLGNITSNDGKLYAVRRHLFNPIADAVTDDLFVCLNIKAQHYRFIFEPLAVAKIPTPSRSQEHEMQRRRRIVTGSLNGMFIQRHLFNPFNYGVFSIGLLVNKVFRRLFGVALIVLLVASYFAKDFSLFMTSIFYVQVIFYSLAIAYPLYLSKTSHVNFQVLQRFSSVFWYFCVGNYATLLGVIDFLSGKRVSKWTPQKQD